MFLFNGQFGGRFPQQLSHLIYSFSFSRRDKILIESLLLLSWEYGNVPTWLNLICQCCHVSEWKQRILFTLPSWSFPRGGCHRRRCLKWKQTLFISQNYVSPLWRGPKSKLAVLIHAAQCCRSATYGACLPLTCWNATPGACHMVHRVAYSNFSRVWKSTLTNEQE